MTTPVSSQSNAPASSEQKKLVTTVPQVLVAACLAPFQMLGRWFCVLWNTLRVMLNDEVAGAPPPPQPFSLPLKPTLNNADTYEVYKDTRARLEAEARRRGDRQWTLMTWVSGLFTAIIGGIIYHVSEGHRLGAPMQMAITAWVLFVGLCAIVRILHDNCVKIYHVKACQQMDEYFGLHFDDTKHKIDLQQHHLFMRVIAVLGIGALFLTWGWELFQDEKASQDKVECPCCCHSVKLPKQ